MSAVTEAPTTTAADVVELLRADRTTRARSALRTGVLVAVVGLLAAALAVAVGGSVQVPLPDVAGALLGRGNGLAQFVVVETRLPRVLVAVLAGAAFGVAGSLYQRVVGNPLATPDVIGVSAGAGAGAVVVLVVIGTSGIAVQGGALAGAGIAAALVMLLGRRSGEGTYRLVLVGIGIAAGFSAVTSYLLARADEATTTRATRWLVGSLSSVTWSDVRVLAVTVVVGLSALVLVAPHLEQVRLGDRVATGLGTRVGHVRLAVLLLGAVLAALATSVTGAIAFVALVAGPVAARLVPGSGAAFAGLVGADLLVVSDLVAQNAPAISPVPTGVVTALVGAPVLLHLLLRPRRTT